MICAGCRRELDIGERYIEDTASGYVGQAADPELDGLIADILGGDATLSGGAGGKVVYCEDCTHTDPAGRYRLQTYFGDELGDELHELD